MHFLYNTFVYCCGSRGDTVVFSNHPKKNWITMYVVLGIALLIFLIGILPFLNIQSDFVKSLIVTAIILICGYPLGKYYYQKYKNKDSFEQRHGRKLR